MPVSLRPCPGCGRPMDSSRTACADCQQAAAQKTVMDAGQRPPRPVPQRHSVPPWGMFFASALIPPAGLVTGLIKAFDADPEQKRLAGFAFAGMALGILAWWLALPVLFIALLARR